MFIRGYLRASSEDQDAERARENLEKFAKERGQLIVAWYIENESGARFDRPELFRLLRDSHPGDVLLVEQVDRLSRLNAKDWDKLKLEIARKRVRIIALDIPLTHQLVKEESDEITDRFLDALSTMLLDVFAAFARKDYEDRRRRQAQGIAKTKGEEPSKYMGRPPNVDRNNEILRLLDMGMSWSQIMKEKGCSRSTLHRLLQARAANSVQ